MFTASYSSKKSRTVKSITSFLIAGAVSFLLGTGALAAETPVELGTAKTFAVLAGSGITNTGATTASGTAGADFGSSPTATFTGSAQVTTSGTKYTAANAAVATAKDALVTAYNDILGRTTTATVAADLGGQTLVPGVYTSSSSLGLTGTLTLNAGNDPNAVFIFKAGSTLTTATNSRVVLTNGAQACNVYWQVGSSATFGTGSQFIGHVLALTSITATTGATFQGQLLARNGAVTLDTNTIVNDACVTAAVVTTTTAPATTATTTPATTATTTPATTATTTPATTATTAPRTTATTVAPTPGAELPNAGGGDIVTLLVIVLLVILIGRLAFSGRR